MRDRKARLARYVALILKACRGSGQTNPPSGNKCIRSIGQIVKDIVISKKMEGVEDMSTYITTRTIRGATVHSYVADTSEEEKKRIVQGVLKVCAQDLMQRKKEEVKENSM